MNQIEFQDDICDEDFLKIFYSTPSTPAKDFKVAIIDYNKSFEPHLSSVKNFSGLVKYINKKYKLETTLKELKYKKSEKIRYNPVQNRDKLEKYVISHDTLLLYCKNIITNQSWLKRLFSDRYPYVLVDEYQDTDEKVIDIIDSIREYSNFKKNFMVGFFGDALQNIYDSGVGTLSNKEEYKSIKKNFNRRSSTQIIDLIEKIRNDNFGQQSMYTDFDNGSYNFYIGSDDFDLDIFLKENSLTRNTACLLMRNDDICKARGFGDLLFALKKFPRFSGNNYENVSNEFLQKNLQHIGWFLRDLLTLLEFVQKSEDNNSTVREIIHFVGGSKSELTFGDMRQFISGLRKFNLSSLTIEECINEITDIQNQISGEDILTNIFSIDATAGNILLNIKNRAYDYFYYSQESEDYSERNMTDIDEFFKLNISQFVKWYKYIFDDLKNETISYHTLHGSKGLEFDNVVCVLQDNFSRKQDYCKYFFEKYNTLTDVDIRFQKVRNLLYVACSRAKINLYVIYVSNTQEEIEKNIKDIFGEIQYLT